MLRKRCFPIFLGSVQEAAFRGSFPRSLAIGTGDIVVHIVRNARARRYSLRLSSSFSARLTVPRGGSFSEAEAFLQKNLAWLERAAERLAKSPSVPRTWLTGTEIYWGGELTKIIAGRPDDKGISASILLRGEEFLIRHGSGDDLRAKIEAELRAVAQRELPPLVWTLAKREQLIVKRVTVRDQHSRWGSCSRRGTVSLNWRILQAPTWVRDYLVIHELMHLKEMNHSRRFWLEVANACPDYKMADRWLTKHSFLLSRRT